MILYHGSTNIIEKPMYGVGKSYNDYGSGFYCTRHAELAKEWACIEGVDGYANRYEINTDGLKVLNLSDAGFSVLNWLAILMQYRITRLSTPIAYKGREYLLENFLPEHKNFDIIQGYRADDSYFSFARAFLNNEISLAQLRLAMQLGDLGEQIVLKSPKAFERICFLDYEIAQNGIYYAKRMERDEKARLAYRKELEAEVTEGIFMRDIIRERMKKDDLRLQ